MDQPELALGLPPVPAPAEPMSRARRLTASNEAKLASGMHPSGHRLMSCPEGVSPPTCGECGHLIVSRKGHTYFKCAVHRLGPSNSGQSDIRLKWPACVKFVPEGGEP